MIESALVTFAAAIVVVATAVFVLVLLFFRKDHYKLGIVLPMEVVSYALVLVAGKSLVLKFAVLLGGLQVQGSYDTSGAAGMWEYVVIIALMAVVVIVALTAKAFIDYKTAKAG
jgi:hypothetical protein